MSLASNNPPPAESPTPNPRLNNARFPGLTTAMDTFLILVLMAAPAFAVNNLIDDTHGVGTGSFELGAYSQNSGNESNYMRLRDGSTKISGWTVGGNDGIDWQSTPSHPAYDGIHSVDLAGVSNIGSPSEGSITVTIPTTVGATYDISFVAYIFGPDPVTGILTAGDLNQEFSPERTPDPGNPSYTGFQYSFTALSETTGITFATINSGGFGPVIDDVKVSLPEFRIIEGDYTWFEAKADAEARGGRLAVLETQERIDSATEFVTSKGSWPGLWLGLTDEAAEGTWSWIDGSTLGPAKWQSGEPSSEAGSDYAWIPPSSLVGGAYWDDRNSSSQGVVDGYLYETLPRLVPEVPDINLSGFYESKPGESVTIDAVPISGYPHDFTYQWFMNDTPIPSFSGGAGSSFVIDGTLEFEGTWRVVVTNSQGTAEATFEYRVFHDSDSDGLSDGREEIVIGSDPSKWDTDDDGLNDRVEWMTHGTSPVLADTDSDGFDDAFELSIGFDPSLDTSTPDTVSGMDIAVEFWFYAADGVSYRIEASKDLTTWTTIETDIIGEGERVDRLYSVREQSKRYFRARRD